MELLGGLPLNLPSRMEVEQEGFEAIDFRASFRSEPLRGPIYYAMRFGIARGRSAWSVALVHHKIFLRDGPEEIESFSITHGFNILTVERSWRLSGLRSHAGVGLVVAHPESRVRGRTFAQNRGLLGTGYHIGGPALRLGVGKRVPLTPRLFVSAEAIGTLTPVRVPIAEGRARFAHVGFHLHLGLGASFRIPLK